MPTLVRVRSKCRRTAARPRIEEVGRNVARPPVVASLQHLGDVARIYRSPVGEGKVLSFDTRTHTHTLSLSNQPRKKPKKSTYIVSMRGIDSKKWYAKITAMSRLQVRFFGHMMIMRKCGAVRAIQAKCGEVIQTSSTKRPRRSPIHGEHRDEKRYGQYNNNRNLNPISRLPSESQCIMKWSLLWIHCLCSAPAFG